MRWRRMRVLFLICLCIVLLVAEPAHGAKKGKKSSKKSSEVDGSPADAEPERVTITQQQYCLGCKATVNLYTNLAIEKITRMKEEGQASGTSFDADSLVSYMCDHEALDDYLPFVGHSCSKLMSQNRTAFLMQFEGKYSVQALMAKADVQEKTRKICYETFAACEETEFTRGEVPKAERDRCAACRVVGEDLDEALRGITSKEAIRDVVESVCGMLGYRHQPYSWIETHCEDMVDDRADEIMELLDYRHGLLGTQQAQSLADEMCDELFSCSQAAKRKSKSKKKKKTSSEL